MTPQVPRFTSQMRAVAPVSFGFKATELVANGALVGKDAGLAFLAGYFCQLCVDRQVDPLWESLGAGATRTGMLLRWHYGLEVLQRPHQSQLLGSPVLRTKFQVRKRTAPVGISRGLYELMRVSSQAAFGQAPEKSEVDEWVRGLFVWSLAVSVPPAKLLQRLPKPQVSAEGVEKLWQATEVGLDRTVEVLTLLSGLIRRGGFSPSARKKLLALCPERVV